MKKMYMPVPRLIEIEYFIDSGMFKFSKDHERIELSEMYNISEAFQLKLAYYLPYALICDELNKYKLLEDTKENWDTFIKGLCVKFNQPKSIIIHRINDVRRIKKYKNK